MYILSRRKKRDVSQNNFKKGEAVSVMAGKSANEQNTPHFHCDERSAVQ
jgi:hypothetical protein